MSEVTEPRHLNNHLRETMDRVFQHPTSHNLEWHDVLSLLEAIGTVDIHRDDKYHVTIDGTTHVFLKPKSKDVDVQLIVDLRKVLREAGYTPTAQ